MWRRERLLFVALVAVGSGDAARPRPASAAESCEKAIHYDRRGALPTVGDQGLSMSCIPWAVRTIVAHHHRRLSPQPRQCHVHFGSFDLSFWAFGWPDLADASNRPSVTYLNNLSLRRWLPSESFDAYVGTCDADLTLTVESVSMTLQQFGAPSELDAPFTAAVDELPTPLQVQSAATLRCDWAKGLGEWHDQSPIGLTSQAKLCAALERGPALLIFAVHRDFRCSIGEEYTPTAHDDSTYLGAHALVVVAYEPYFTGVWPNFHGPRAAFRVMNSWGPNWGSTGFTWISADYLFDERESQFPASHVYRFDALAGVACPDPTLTLPEKWTTGDDVPWREDDGPTSCTKKPPPCLGPPTRVPGLRPDPGAHYVDVERKACARVQIVAPAIPLVPALFDSTVRYWVDGQPAADIDPSATGFRLRFVDRTPKTSWPAPKPPPPPKVGPVDPAPAPDRPAARPKAGSAADLGIGADPSKIGAFVDRAMFEIVDPDHSNLVGGKTVRVRVEVYDPGASEPRAVARYRIRISE